MEYKEPLHEIWGKNGGGALTQFLDRWHPLDPKADPYDPATVWTSGHYAYTGRWAKNNSAFNRVSTAYLRLKSIELVVPFEISLSRRDREVVISAIPGAFCTVAIHLMEFSVL